jgi:hypothetical protein
MKTLQIFTHRRPANGIHLLSDPFPTRLNATTTLFERAESLSSQREFLSSTRRIPMVSFLKKA